MLQQPAVRNSSGDACRPTSFILYLLLFLFCCLLECMPQLMVLPGCSLNLIDHGRRVFQKHQVGALKLNCTSLHGLAGGLCGHGCSLHPLHTVKKRLAENLLCRKSAVQKICCAENLLCRKSAVQSGGVRRRRLGLCMTVGCRIEHPWLVWLQHQAAITLASTVLRSFVIFILCKLTVLAEVTAALLLGLAAHSSTVLSEGPWLLQLWSYVCMWQIEWCWSAASHCDLAGASLLAACAGPCLLALSADTISTL